MSLPPNYHWFAAAAFERLLYCLTAGIALVAAMSLTVRLFPARNSRTRFAVWFGTLVAVAVMPLIAFNQHWRSVLKAGGAQPQHALITIPATWAEYAVLAWTVVALLGIARVAAGLWQIRRLRRGCVDLDLEMLSCDSQSRIAALRKRRSVSILVSSDLEVPTALGFLRAAIVIPAWLTDEQAATELDYVLLHELAHLERWDDWSNLFQKLVKSVLFFHPAVWWIERKLSLDREMACDDAVLAQSRSPRLYAECLTRVAEKNFLRRQLALAQAAVDRMRQLSRRVAHILDPDHSAQPARLWKPALPMVVAVAALCAASAWQTPALVRLREFQPVTPGSSSSSLQIPLGKIGGADPVMSKDQVSESIATVVPARAIENGTAPGWPSGLKPAHWPARAKPVKHVTRPHKPGSLIGATYSPGSETNAPVMVSSIDGSLSDKSIEPGKNSMEGMIVLVVATQRIMSTGSVVWQVRTWELRLTIPASHSTKQIPRKT